MKYLVTLPDNSTRATFFTPENISLAQTLGEVAWNTTGAKITPEAVAAARDADAYVTAWGSPALGGELLELLPNVRVLVHLCGTVVPFVSGEMWERGVKVIGGNDFFAESVAEGCIAYILTAQRKIPRYLHSLKTGHIWKKPVRYNEGLIGKTVGIMGCGAVARHLIRMLQPFGVKIKICDIVELPAEYLAENNAVQTSAGEVFSSSDIISLHVAGNAGTRHMIGAELLRCIPDGALLLNTSRGYVIDETALIEELKKERFTAFLDVFETEPPAPENELYSLDNVYMMPHMAGPTVDRRAVITSTLLREAHDFITSGICPKHEITRAAAARMSDK